MAAVLTTHDARRALLEHLIDHAALFPPASLPMEAGLAEDARARESNASWLLGRFLCPASRLHELPAGTMLPLAVVMDGAGAAPAGEWLGAVETEAERIEASGAERVEGLELRLPDPEPKPDLVAAAAARLGRPGVQLFLEVPLGRDWQRSLPATIAAIAAASAGAKLRCGGVVPEAFPSPAQVALFVHACRSEGVAFKATAGLHHPVRHVDPATGFTTHGFLNLLAAAVFAHARDLDVDELAGLLGEERPDRFRVTSGALTVGELTAGPAEIARARRELFVGYGSCSFTEPVDDLRSLGVLAA